MGTSASRPRARARAGSRPRPTTLTLDADVYSAAALDRARTAFSHLASIDVRKDGRHRTIRFSNMDPDVAERLADEFANYALSCLLVNP